MKTLLAPLLIFLAVNSYAQDKPLVISPKTFNPQFDVVLIDQLDGWYFRSGNDTTWAQTDISTAGWKKLSPLQLSAKYADKNGKVEGWFRIKIKLDSSVSTNGMNIFYGSYAPADIYINGKRIGSYGHTGLYGHPYAEFDVNSFAQNLPLSLKRGEKFTLALHLVDSLAPFVPAKLKSRCTNVENMIAIGGGNSVRLVFSDAVNFNKSYSTWLWISLTLCILFWLLALQNRREKVLFLIAGCATFFVSWIYSGSIEADIQTPPCSIFIFYQFLTGFSILLVVVSIPVTIAEVFKRRISLWIKIGLAIVIICGVASFFLPLIRAIITAAGVLFPLGISLYYIISSWKNLKGAQWSVVAGLLGSFFFMLTIAACFVFQIQAYRNFGIGYFLTSGTLLSFPVSLLVYVALRFKEIINEVRHNASEVVRLSDEKKEEAINRQKLLQEEVDRQTAEIRANQARLIQSEKMASLGELTAGIAHEIQNPLNFVNNFSDVSIELLDELKEEEENNNKEDVIAITDVLTQNLQKIRHHGQRADAIVKGMLQHSRTSSGQKEPTDINALTDEYLRLAYHGIRAKDKDFNAELITHFDANLPKVKAVPQDIGRVLLNVINNAFYAVQQKAKTAVANYKPTIEVSTMQQNGSVAMSVKDNGNGIPDAIKDKIMQPFFTTKPTGEGTGLGLSLSYDIVVKGHGGKISVDTKEGEGSEFTILLPNH